MADDFELVFDSQWVALRVRVDDSRLVLEVDADDGFYSHEWTLTAEQTHALSTLIAQTPTTL